jgi:hypothetical protein
MRRATLIFSMLACVAALWQLVGLWRMNLSADLTLHPDEAAHYVTGVMVRDFVLGGEWRDPIGFASAFYARYPKVLLGHWPPTFYGIEGAWFLVFGVGVEQARALQLLAALVFGVIWLLMARRTFDWPVALAGLAAVWMSLLVRQQTATLLTDLMTSLLVMAALELWLRQAQAPSWRKAVAMVLLGALAVLCKANGWILGVVMGLTPLLAGDWSIFRRKWFWLCGVAIAALGLPFYLWVARMRAGYPPEIIPSTIDGERMLRAYRYASAAWDVFPAWVWALAVLGVIVGFRLPPGEQRLRWAMAASMVLAMTVFLGMGFSGEPRVMMPAYGFVLWLVARAVVSFAELFGGPQSAVPTAILVLAAVASPRWAPDAPTGLQAAVRELPYARNGNAILVLSEPVGEGAVIVERLNGDVSRNHMVLRGTKALLPGNAPLDALIAETPVEYVILDPKVYPTLAFPRLQLVGTKAFGRREAQIWRNVAAAGKPLRGVRYRLGKRRGDREVEWRNEVGAER